MQLQSYPAKPMRSPPRGRKSLSLLRARSTITESRYRVERALSLCLRRHLCRRADALICRRCLISRKKDGYHAVRAVTHGCPRALTFSALRAGPLHSPASAREGFWHRSSSRGLVKLPCSGTYRAYFDPGLTVLPPVSPGGSAAQVHHMDAAVARLGRLVGGLHQQTVFAHAHGLQSVGRHAVTAFQEGRDLFRACL